jgi:hypothetical protein
MDRSPPAPAIEFLKKYKMTRLENHKIYDLGARAQMSFNYQKAMFVNLNKRD